MTTIDRSEAVAAMGRFFELLDGVSEITLSADEYRKTLLKAVDTQITTHVVAEILDVCPQTVLNMVKDGRLTAVNKGSSKLRFQLSEILEYKLRK
jgi:excisionase family DNA binding protein